mmetsp:Transcript_82272/g.145806  ORF Transcript_82272/g.145806 Transcript_82272/m.145806 type:complete len:432 (-) Transcript_82272:28-1323(-)
MVDELTPARPDRPTTPGLPWVLLLNAVIAIDYSLIMPTGWQYISEMHGSEMFYGMTIAAFPIGRLCLLLPMGAWSDRRPFSGPFCTSISFGCLGGIIYGLASVCHCKWFALLGRFLNGCGATAPTSAWAAYAYPPAKRVQIESIQKASQLIGVVLGPAINVFFTRLDYKLGFLEFNARTCAGYFPALLNIVLLLGFWRCVGEPPRDLPRTTSNVAPLKQLWQAGACVCLLCAFHTNLQITAVDVVISPLTSAHLGWDLLDNSSLFAGMAILSLIGAVLGLLANRRGMAAMHIMLVGAILNLASTCALCIALLKAPGVISMQLFMASGAIMIVAILIYAGPTGGVYQQACGTSQGLLGGIYSMAYASGRPIGALLAGALLSGSPLPMCFALVFFVIFAISLQLLFWRRLDRTVQRALFPELADSEITESCTN